jgi:hypothetical protein
MSKHQLLEHWPQLEFAQDVAKIVRFAQFYGNFIPWFELQIAPLYDLITKLEYTKPVAPHWTTATQDSFNGKKQAFLSDPCLKHFEHNHRIVLGQNSCQRGSATLFANQEMTLLWLQPWTRTAPELTSVLWLRIPWLSFIQSHLALGAAMEMKLGCTLTLMKVLLVIGPWTSAATCSLANALYYWLQIGTDLCFEPLFKAHLELTW